ncbi:hypothetical protein ACIHFC_14190 [Streptomyces sp. NPDC052013]|uniref:hypothetical protein n=1 Tax=unclassified Streptomyces TaxID=2593676 RepID=UPI00344B9DD6
MWLTSGDVVSSGNDPSADWSGDECRCELLGPQQTNTEALSRSARLAKFHVPEIVSVPVR